MWLPIDEPTNSEGNNVSRIWHQQQLLNVITKIHKNSRQQTSITGDATEFPGNHI
jgi:hypothetical protein